MAITMLVPQSDGGDILAADWNAEFLNIINNAKDLISPWTGDMAAGGNRLTGLSAGSVSNASLQPTGDANTGFYFSAADTVDVAAGGVRSIRFNTATTGVNFLDVTPAAAGSGPVLLATGSDTDVNQIYDTKGAGIHIFKHGGTEVMRSRALTNGQLIVGSTGATAVAATLTAGNNGITITNGAGTITLSMPVPLRCVVKAANEVVNNSVTLQDDDELLISVEASKKYLIRLYLLAKSASATSDIKVGWTAPAGAAFYWGSYLPAGVGASWTAVPNATTPNTALLLIGGTDNYGLSTSADSGFGIVIEGILVTAGTAGNLQFKWAQNTQTVEDVTVEANSTLLAWTIG